MLQSLVLVLVFASAQSLNVSSEITDHKRVFSLRARIVGGRQTKIEDFPYQVSLLHLRAHVCGGSIYKEDIVITAAHCLSDIKTRELAVVAGTTDWGHGGVESGVRSSVKHPRFSRNTLDFDIAILKLTRKLPFGPTIQPIKLPNYRQEFKPGTVGVVSGWGALGEDDHDPDELQYTAMKVISHQECFKAYRDIHQVSKNMMCAWVRSGGHGTCQGDSGGALVIGNVMAGIVSWGLGCARPNVPEVYTKVSSLRKWMDLQFESLR